MGIYHSLLAFAALWLLSSNTYIGRGDGRDDEVEAVGVLLGPALFISSGNVVSATKLDSFIALSLATGDTNNLVGAEGLGEEDGKVAKTTDTNDTNLLPGTAAPGTERRVDGDTTAEERSSVLGL